MKIKICVKVKRNPKSYNFFSGEIVFKDYLGNVLLSYDYNYGNPENTRIDITFTNSSESKFGIEGFPDKKEFEKLNKRQQIILAIGLEYISEITIVCAKSLSFEKAVLLREFRGFDIFRTREWDLELKSSVYTLIFNKKVTE